MTPFGLDFTNPRLTPLDLATALSEQGVCLLTGETENLVYLPVDGDPANVLPSNVACLSPAGMALSQPTRFGYFLPLVPADREPEKGPWWGVDIESPYSFLEYNLGVFDVASASISSWGLDPLNPSDSLVKVFTELVKLHAKGIKEVSCQLTGLALGWKSYQSYLITQSRTNPPVRLVTV